MNFLHGRGHWSSQTTKEGIESILLAANLEPVCATDQVLKHCYQQKVEECNRMSFERSLPTCNYVSQITRANVPGSPAMRSEPRAAASVYLCLHCCRGGDGGLDQ